MSAPRYVHASAVLVGEAAVLIRGASGSGKSALARAIIDAGRRDGRFCRLVGDDRVGLAPRNGRLVATPHPLIAGRIEARGQGLLAAPHVAAAVVRLVVDIAETPERLPADGASVAVEGVRLPLLVVQARSGAAADQILALLPR